MTGFRLAVGFSVLYSFYFKSGVAGIHGPVRPFEAPLGGKRSKGGTLGFWLGRNRLLCGQQKPRKVRESAGKCFSCLWSGSESGHVG